MIYTITLHIFVLLCNILCCSSYASNLALKKIYTISPLPNYALTAPPTDTTSLTDGNYTFGHFWTKKTTLGWQSVRTVEILIDLGRVSNIDSIVFSTARGEQAGVNYPAQIATFIGSSKDQYIYVGDIANNPRNIPGPYQVDKFSLNGIAVMGRYVLLEVRSRGSYLFCDEIEVLAGDHVIVKAETLSLEGARNVAENLYRLGIEKKFLTYLIDNIKISTILDTENIQVISEIQQRINNLDEIKDVEQIEEDIFRCRASVLRNLFPGKGFFLETVNPWSPLLPTKSLVDNISHSISMVIPQGGYDHAAYVVTNLTADSQEITHQIGTLPHDAPTIAFYHVPFVKSYAMEFVADPLLPITGSFTLRSGESRMVILSVHGGQPGNWQSTLKISNGAEINSLPLTLQVPNVAIPIKSSLNSINWGYLDFKPIRDSKPAAVEDLFSHHTNTFVVPPAYLPLDYPSKSRDVSRLDSYLQLHKGAAKILFFADFNNENLLTLNGKYPFMSNEWKKMFKNYYIGLVESGLKADLPEDKIYLYPFDEMKDADADRFIELAEWAKKEIPSIKFYATLDRIESFKALPYLSIAQVIYKEPLYADALASKKEVWLYGTAENTKSLSPYSYYRLMPWQAFFHGFTGVGFWNYADTGWGDNPGSSWNDFDGSRPDFAVIYEGENGAIVSSRRWEAWRMGIEDYELLTKYAKTKGDNKAKSLAKSVLDNPQDVSRADTVRRQILNELSQSIAAPQIILVK